MGRPAGRRPLRPGPVVRAQKETKNTQTPLIADTDQELIRRFIDALDAHRRHLEEAQRLSWGDVEEANFVPSATSLTLEPQAENEARIDFIMAYAGVTAGKCGLIVMGDALRKHTFVVPPGTLLATSCRIRLKNTDLRQIATTTLTNNAPTYPADLSATGFLYLALFGQEIPVGARRW